MKKKTAVIGVKMPGSTRRRTLKPVFGGVLLSLSLVMLGGLASPPHAAAFEFNPEETFWKKEIAKPEEFLTDEQMAYLKGSLEPLADQVVITVDLDPPIILRADRIESDRTDRLNHFVGNILISRGSETVTADRALWHDGTNSAELTGNIKIVTPEFTVMAERAVVNMDLKMAKIYDGQAFFPTRNYYISGAVIERLGDKVINVKDGTATTCDGPSPAWTIHADNLTVTEGGYATASGVSFNTRYAPVMAVPYFMFPVKNERQSGVLFPGIANSSRDGLTVGLPFFWASGENHDFTYTPVWRNKRGFSNTLEGRFHFERGKGIWQASYLKDLDPQKYFYNNDSKEQTARERYWLRAQNNWNFGQWDINLNLDLASDPLYLSEFRNDFDGFFSSRDAFSKQFGYTVNENLDPLRSNTFFIQRTGYDSFLRGGAEYTQDLYSKNNHDTVQKLPSVQYNLVSRPLPQELGDGLGLRNLPRFSLGMRYDYFSRLSNSLSDTDETGHRFLLKPSMLWSSPVSDLANFELDADLGLAMYNANGYRPYNRNTVGARDKALHAGQENRLTGSLTASLSTTLSKVYGGFGDAVAVRHQMSPTVSFSYVDAPEDQSKLPYWDYYDRRLSRQAVRYGFLNTFVKKTPAFDEEGLAADFDYFQFLKVGLWSSYEFKDNMKWANEPDARYHTTDYFDRGAGPIELEVEAFFNPNFSARLISGIDGRTGRVSSHDLSMKIADKRGDSLTLTYDFDSPSTALGTGVNYEDYEEVRADLAMIFNEDWSADFSTRYDIRAGKGLESHARIMYRNQCYGLGLLYSDTRDDRRIGLVVDLLGFGSLNSESRALASSPEFFYR